MKRVLYKEASALSRLSITSYGWWLSQSREELIQHCKIGGGLKHRQNQVASIYERFKLEINLNLKHISDEAVPAYFKELYSLFLLKQPQQERIEALQSIVLSDLDKEARSINDGANYQTLAWKKIQIRLSGDFPTLDDASRKRLGVLYTVATGTSYYWQLAVGEIRSQLATIGHSPLPKTIHQDSLLIQVEGQTETKEDPSRDTWGNLLQGGLTVVTLKKLLSELVPPMLDTSGNVTPDSKPGSWAAAIAALRDSRKIIYPNNAALHRNIVSVFGKVASVNQLQNGYKADNEKMFKIFVSVQELAKALTKTL
ncbi:hypothetical protein [Hymenobacter sp. UYCo722]|uniref:hypothetical protein n=1 Tax=Hymenobacter sp. UYCo722 TaxID=3156335 RepID=UPI003399837D